MQLPNFIQRILDKKKIIVFPGRGTGGSSTILSPIFRIRSTPVFPVQPSSVVECNIIQNPEVISLEH